MTTFPFGYARPPNGGPQGMGTQLTWEQMLTKSTVNLLHPEVLRRFGALIHDAAAAGVPLGVGTGWRVQPNPPPAGFAKPGNSWHESCPVSPTSATALAIDTVPNISWDWLHVHCGKYGLRHFKYVNNEPWHCQPAEISTSRKYATTPPALVVWDLPGDEPQPPQPPEEEEDDMPKAVLITARDDPNHWVFAWNGFEMNQLSAGGSTALGTGGGLYASDKVDASLSKQEIQWLISSCWTGGWVPDGYDQPDAPARS